MTRALLARKLNYYLVDVHHATGKPRVTLSTAGTAFQAYQPGATYQPTSQYPTEQLHRSPNAVGSSARPGSGGETGGGYRGTEEPGVDTADESDVVSIKPAKYRSGNTFTVKKVSKKVVGGVVIEKVRKKVEGVWLLKNR